ncbi:MAG: hypothetical protein B6U97_00340 [Candidatus Altiarchaeales archaeon ex4484_96]|nr:MAG: hypothetical protein B6U97_00340 [Candidatus Altiarchaeales archaeon ex4484_96]
MEYKILRLPPSLRKGLKKPLGEVFCDIRDLRVESDNLVCVGDRVSQDALEAGFYPWLIVYDGRIKRKYVGVSSVIEQFKAKLLEVKNPAGLLTPEVFRVLGEVFDSDEKYKLYIDGEEDLVTLVAIKLAPLGSVVVYGQPGEGLVAVEVTEGMRVKVNNMMERMG